ncbi:MAG: CoA-binding protein [Bdellovibrionota bacterium]
MNISDSEIKKILLGYKKITVIGLSPDENKPSQGVPVFMRSHGYDLVGVYPKETEINGFRIFQSLAEVSAEYRQFINVFRASNKIPDIVDEVLKVGGVKVLWLQLGIENAEAEKRAEAAGILVVSNRCLKIEYRKHLS